ncbi:hypothetical protein LAZ40_22575 [Cereibacter sphaeroides]|uniref:hypothetical protein n=1 Tax=Rhodobacterales TaxID=204455 RepID=UPI000BBF271D|nr:MULTISPECIES: hypothetical protein [Paracoccaceae]MCE6953076.1 hypothetical protein [Cereibacter sphaeroides]MCE6961825.1 hypothetical protein [Cereibacter sphaeroides]MCE6970600.1 hypothetical protein [Cereibacter sphaeroides]MCE6975804.1 hypothetical protein [Cereibacter sphaeroides]
MSALLFARIAAVGEIARLESDRQRLVRTLSGLEIEAAGGAAVDAGRAAAEEALAACDLRMTTLEARLAQLDRDLAAEASPGEERKP